MKKINGIVSFFKGVLFAVGITVIGVAVLALIAKDTDGKLVSGISVGVKFLSIISGTVYTALKLRKRGAIVGLIVSVIYWIICILLSLFASPLSFSWSMLSDLLLTLLAGSFAGILTVNALK